MFEELRNRHGERIDSTFHPGDRRNAEGELELVVIGHGVTGNKDRPWAVTLADVLAASGYSALRLSFAGNGASEGDFRAATVSKETDDLESVIDALYALDEKWAVTFAGHSMGGAVGVLAANRDARIRRLVSLAGMVHTHDFAMRKFGELTPDVDCMWQIPECPLSQLYMDDMRTIGSVAEAGAGVRVPWLLIHGTEDTVVPIDDAHDILEHGRGELVKLEGVDHVFTDAAHEMAAKVVVWLSNTP